MQPHNISVLLVDDHSLVRRGFRRLLEDEPDIEVVGEASDGQDAVTAADELKPSVVVMDFALPSMNGAVATRMILKQCPKTAVLMLSMHSETNYVRTCLEAGVRGYLLKSAMDLELVLAVKQVASGMRVLDPRLRHLQTPAGNAIRALTTREMEVLQLIVHGKSNKDIAAVLGLSVNTISVHRTNILQSLGVHNTAEMVVCAIRSGLATIA
jgi:DNA-binding NarL/FixJ family response regulator